MLRHSIKLHAREKAAARSKVDARLTCLLTPAGALALPAPHTHTLLPSASAHPQQSTNWAMAQKGPSSNNSAGAGSQGTQRGRGSGREPIHLGKLQLDVEGARRAAMQAAACSKTAEGLLQGLRQALPEWMEVSRARVRCLLLLHRERVGRSCARACV